MADKGSATRALIVFDWLGKKTGKKTSVGSCLQTCTNEKQNVDNKGTAVAAGPPYKNDGCNFAHSCSSPFIDQKNLPLFHLTHF